MKIIIKVLVLSSLVSLTSGANIVYAGDSVKDTKGKYIRSIKDKSGQEYKTRSKRARDRKEENIRIEKLEACQKKARLQRNVNCSKFEKKESEEEQIDNFN